jgi:hypothetical protein
MFSLKFFVFYSIENVQTFWQREEPILWGLWRPGGYRVRLAAPSASDSASSLPSMSRVRMNHLQKAVAVLNRLLLRKSPQTFSSVWILKRAPRCYSFIRKHIRSEVGGIDWDKITYALEPKYQRLWTPRPRRKAKPYRDTREIGLILDKYRNKLYVFVAAADANDLQIRDMIAIALVRVAQGGNLLAKAEVIELVRHTIDEWLDNYSYLSRWRGRDDEIREHLEGCIRRYRYSGSFLRYVFRTLECAGRGIRPLCAYSLDDPMTIDARERKIDNVIRDSETNEIVTYEPKRTLSFDSGSQIDGR